MVRRQAVYQNIEKLYKLLPHKTFGFFRINIKSCIVVLFWNKSLLSNSKLNYAFFKINISD
jgi:hypothetical protein